MKTTELNCMEDKLQKNVKKKNCPPDTYTRLAKDFISHTCILNSKKKKNYCCNPRILQATMCSCASKKKKDVCEKQCNSKLLFIVQVLWVKVAVQIFVILYTIFKFFWLDL